MSPTRKAPDRASTIAGGVLVALVLLAFAPALTGRFGFADDFPYLFESTNSVKWQVEGETRAGRPLAGAMRAWGFGILETTPNLVYARLVAIAIIAAFGVLLWRHLVRRGFPNAPAAAIAAIVSTVPPFGIYAGWAMLVAYAPPFLLTLVAARGFSVAASERWRRSAARFATSVAAMVIALAMYPPSTGMLWLWFSVDLLTRKGSTSDRLKWFGWTLAGFVTSLGLYLAAYRLSGLQHARAQMTADPLGKLTWLVNDVIPWVARLQWLPDGTTDPSRLIPLLVMALAASAFFAWRDQPARDRLVAFLLWCATLPLAHFALVAAVEREITERSIVALSCVIALAAAVGVWRVSRIVAGDRWASVALVTLAIAAGWLQNANTRQFVRKQQFEYEHVRAAIAGRRADVTRVVMVQPVFAAPAGRGVPTDEYQLLTSVLPIEYHMMGAFAALVARESGRSLAGSTLVPHSQAVAPEPGVLVLPMDPVMARLSEK